MIDPASYSTVRLESVLHKLEFDKVIHRITHLSSSDVGKERSATIVPLRQKQDIELEHRRVSEAKELLIAEGSVPLTGVKNIFPALKKTSIANQFLTVQELIDVASTLRASRSMHAFLSKRRQQYPLLALLAERLLSDKVVEYNITEALDEQGFVKDKASKELRTIRKDKDSIREQLRKTLVSILRQVSEQEFLQEEIITTRDGRLVIPVKVEHKNHVPGFIHSTSASGATVYIEPAQTLDLNNSLRELHLREEREIQRILVDLTSQVMAISGPLEVALHMLGELDVLFAKARYSIEIIGNPPQLTESAFVKLIQARHPLLLQRHQRDEVIPLDIQLDGQVRTLVITGPNAGGKTVALKTVGLLTLCALSGIHIPASSESVMCVFQMIFVDIGDDQSLENDISTFSSHLERVKEILTDANDCSLVLIDEIGAGTDPAEGGALAISVLKELTDRGTTTIATTHNGMLKVLAHDTPGMANGSMEFDQDSLKPTYKFRFGVPGSSFALELAGRMGIPKDILEKARGQLGDEKSKLERLIADLERQSQRYSGELQEASHERDRLQSLLKVYEEKMSDLKKELSGIKRKAVEEAQELVKGARATIEKSVREIRESAGSKESVRSSHQKVSELIQRFQIGGEDKSDTSYVPVAVGDLVRIRESIEVGEVLELQGDTVVVLRANAKIKVKRKELTKVSRQVPVVNASVPSMTLEVKSEIDVRGLLGDEALEQVQNFLDNAYAAGLHRVDIIHGKGTGALRKRVTEFLKSYPKAKAFRLGEWNQGGTGVTVVELID